MELIKLNDKNEIRKVLNTLQDMELEKKEIENEIKEMKVNLKTAMEEHNIKSLDGESYKITLIADSEDTEVEVFNEKQFKEDEPVMYEMYIDTKIKKGRKGYVKITDRNKIE